MGRIGIAILLAAGCGDGGAAMDLGVADLAGPMPCADGKKDGTETDVDNRGCK